MEMYLYSRSWSTEQSRTVQRNISSSNWALCVGEIWQFTRAGFMWWIKRLELHLNIWASTEEHWTMPWGEVCGWYCKGSEWLRQTMFKVAANIKFKNACFDWTPKKWDQSVFGCRPWRCHHNKWVQVPDWRSILQSWEPMVQSYIKQ
jgi:hypothetical protein